MLQLQDAQLQLTQSITIGKLCKSAWPLRESPLNPLYFSVSYFVCGDNATVNSNISRTLL